MALQTMAYVSFHFVGATNPTSQPKQTSVDAAFMRSPIKTFEICERQSANLRNRSISQRKRLSPDHFRFTVNISPTHTTRIDKNSLQRLFQVNKLHKEQIV